MNLLNLDPRRWRLPRWLDKLRPGEARFNKLCKHAAAISVVFGLLLGVTGVVLASTVGHDYYRAKSQAEFAAMWQPVRCTLTPTGNTFVVGYDRVSQQADLTCPPGHAALKQTRFVEPVHKLHTDPTRMVWFSRTDGVHYIDGHEGIDNDPPAPGTGDNGLIVLSVLGAIGLMWIFGVVGGGIASSRKEILQRRQALAKSKPKPAAAAPA